MRFTIKSVMIGRGADEVPEGRILGRIVRAVRFSHPCPSAALPRFFGLCRSQLKTILIAYPIGRSRGQFCATES